MKLKTILHSFTRRTTALILLLTVGAAGSGVWADTSTLTFTKACGGSGTADDDVKWTVTSDASESTYDATKGIHYGTGSAAVSYVQLVSGAFTKTVTSVVVNTSNASKGSSTVTVTVGETSFKCNGNTSASAGASAANYTFTGSATGAITVRVSKTSAKNAIYVKSIVVTYSGAPDAPTFSPAAGEIEKGNTVTLSAAEGCDIYYTMGDNPADPTSSSTAYSSAIAITEATTIKAIAVKGGLSSTVASASYTLLKPDAPTFSVAAKAFDASFDMTISGPTGTTLKYTTDGSDPASGTAVDANTKTITIPAATTTVKAISIKDGVSSNVSSVTYTYDARTTPTFSLSSTDYALKVNDEGSITLTTNSDGTITFESSDDDHLIVDNTDDAKVGTLLADQAGVYTVTVSVTGSATYKNASDEVTVTVTKKATATAIDDSGITNTDVYTSTAAGSLAATVSYNASAIGGATVTWTSSDTGVATIASNGAVTLKAAGSTTITATYAGTAEYDGSSNTYVLTVTDSTPMLPFELVTSVSQLAEGDVITFVNESAGVAIGAQKANNFGETSVSIENHAFEIKASNTTVTRFTLDPVSNSSNWRFKIDASTYLSAKSSSANQMGTATSSADDNAKASISISNNNATITFKGSYTRNVVQYNSSSDLFSCYSSASQDAVQIYKKVKYANTITTTTAYTVDLTKPTPDEGVILSATATNGTVYYTVKSSSLDADEYDFEDGVLLVESTAKSGVIVITAKCDETSTHKAAEDVDITVTVVGAKVDPTIAVSNDAVTYGSTYVVDTSDFLSGEVSLSSGNTAVATVEGLTVTPVAVGTVTITVNTEATSMYKVGSKTFELTVNAPAGSSTAAKSATTSTATLDFSDNSEWGFPEGSSNKTAEANSYDNGTYTLTLTGQGYYYNTNDNYLLIGQNGATVELPTFDKFVTKIDVVGRTGAGTNTLQNIYVGSEAVSTQTKGVTGTNSYEIASEYQAPGTTYTLKIESSHNSQITSIKFYLTDVATFDVSLNSSGYATFCSQYPLDFTNSLENGYSAWQITEIDSDNKITFERITGAVKGGTGVLLKGNDDKKGETISIPSVASSTTLSGNLLKGTLAPTYFAADAIYGLSGDTFYPNNAMTLPAGKAYLDKADVPSHVKAFTFIFNDSETGISETRSVSAAEAEAIFNMAGQRVDNSQLKRGIYVVNGRKVIVR